MDGLILLIAFAISLPELVTSIIAARKGESAIAVGNALIKLKQEISDILFRSLLSFRY